MDQQLYEIKKAKLTGNEVVVQHNELVDAPRILNQQEQKLFMFLVSKINPDDKEFHTFRVTVEEFAKAVGVSNTKNTYRDLQEISKRLMSKVITIHIPEEKLITQTNILDYIDYFYGKGYADIRLSSKLAPYLLGLRRDFTQYKLSQVIVLSSIYAMRIYEMLKKQDKFGSRTFFIDELKKQLAIKDDQYIRFNAFKLKVLEIAKREINEKTDMMIDFKFKKSGRKIVAVEFDIKPKNQKKAEEQPKFLELYNDSSHDEYVDEIMQYGFKRASINRMLSELEDHQIENALLAVKEQIQNGKCKTPKAMLKTALKECWTPSRSTQIQKAAAISIDQACENLSAPKTEEKIQSSLQKKTGFFTFLNKIFNK